MKFSALLLLVIASQGLAQLSQTGLTLRSKETFPNCQPTGSPWLVASADFNRDGLADVVAADFRAGCLQYFAGDRQAGMRRIASFNLPFFAQTLSVARFTNDSFPDVVAYVQNENLSPSSPTNFLCVLLNRNGTLQSPNCTPYPLGSFIVSDIDGDGFSDLLAPVPVSPPEVLRWLRFNEALGVFESRGDIPVFRATIQTAFADFNRDGRMDLAYSVRDNNNTSEAVYVQLGRGSGQFDNPIVSPLPERCSTRDFQSADLDQDGFPDLVALCDDGQSLRAYRNRGSAAPAQFNVSSTVRVPSQTTPQNFTMHDLDADGIPNVLVPAGDGIFFFPQRLAAFAPPILIFNGVSGAVVAGDFNGDPFPDLFYSTTNTLNRFFYFLTGGPASFSFFLESATSTVPIGAQSDIVASMVLNEVSAVPFQPSSIQLRNATNEVLASVQPEWFPFTRPGGQGDTVARARFTIRPQDAGVFDYSATFNRPFSLQQLRTPPLRLTVPRLASSLVFNLSSTVRESPSPLLLPITIASPLASRATGQVSLTDEAGRTLATAPVLSGAVTLSVPASQLTVGPNFFTLRYTGDLNHQPANSSPQPVFVIGNAVAANAAAPSLAANVLAPASLATLYLSRSLLSPSAAQSLPLPTSLGQLSLRLESPGLGNRLLGLQYVGGSQINFYLPEDLPPGLYTLAALLLSGQRFETTLRIAPVSPGIFSMPSTQNPPPAAAQFVADIDGQRQNLLSFQCPTADFCATAPRFIPPSGAVLVLYATGLRNHATLEASLSPLEIPTRVVPISVDYAGAHPSILGLDQVNLRLPADLSLTGKLRLTLRVDGANANPVAIELI